MTRSQSATSRPTNPSLSLTHLAESMKTDELCRDPIQGQVDSMSETLPQDAAARLVRAGLLTAAIDGLFSSVLAQFFYGSTVARLFQGVASVPLGADALNGGTRAAAIGIGIHVCVAFAWSAIFLFVFMRLSWIRRTLEEPLGAFKIAALYGPLVWVTMSFVIVPLFPPHRFPQNWTRWWIQFIGHAPFVGLPIVASIAGRFGAAKAARVSMA